MSGLSSVPPSSTQNSGFIVDAMPKTVLSGLQWTVSALPLALTGRRFYQGARPASIEAGLVVSFLSRTFANFIRNLELANLKGTTALDYFSEYLLGKPAEVLFQSPRSGTMPIVEHSALAIRDGITPSLLIDGLSTQNALSTFNTIKQYAKAPLETWSDSELISKLKVPEDSTLEETKALFTRFLELKKNLDVQNALLVIEQHDQGLATQNLHSTEQAYNAFKTSQALISNLEEVSPSGDSSVVEAVKKSIEALETAIVRDAGLTTETEEVLEMGQQLLKLKGMLSRLETPATDLEKARVMARGILAGREASAASAEDILHEIETKATTLATAEQAVSVRENQIRKIYQEMNEAKFKILSTNTYDAVPKSNLADLPEDYKKLADALKRMEKKFPVNQPKEPVEGDAPAPAAPNVVVQRALKALDALFFAYRVYDFLKEQKAHNDAVKAAQKLGPTLS